MKDEDLTICLALIIYRLQIEARDIPERAGCPRQSKQAEVANAEEEDRTLGGGE